MLLEKLKQNDYDRYISTLLAPKDKIADILTLLEFNIEIASVKNRVSEQMIGLIRLEWWREAIEEIYDEAKTPRNHIIVNKLAGLCEKYKFNKTLFLTLINTREKDLEAKPFSSKEEFYSYALNSSLPLNNLISIILGVSLEENDQINYLIKCYSKSWAIISILYSANKNFAKNRNILPLDLCNKYNLKIDNYGSEEFIRNSQNIVKEVISEAKELNEASLKNLDKNSKKILKPVLSFKYINASHIKQIEKNNYNIFSKNYNKYFSLKTLFKIFWI